MGISLPSSRARASFRVASRMRVARFVSRDYRHGRPDFFKKFDLPNGAQAPRPAPPILTMAATAPAVEPSLAGPTHETGLGRRIRGNPGGGRSLPADLAGRHRV